MNRKSRSPRRDAGQWQAIVNQQSSSGMSVPEYCRAEGIAYQSFMNWRRKLSSVSHELKAKSDAEPAFIELTTQADDQQQDSQRWSIELDLAPGVQLRIAR